MRVKVLCLTTSHAQLVGLVPLLRLLYFSGKIDGLTVVNSEAEFADRANPWITRRLSEYSAEPAADGTELAGEKFAAAARRAVLQERPEVILLPKSSPLEAALNPTLKEAGIGLVVWSPDEDKGLNSLLAKFRGARAQSVARPMKGQDPRSLMEEHWTRLASSLEIALGPCLLLGNQTLIKECQARFPDREFHLQPEQERYSQGISLFSLSYLQDCEPTLETLRSRCESSLLLEPVNTQMSGARYTLRYGDYDNEFSFTEAEVDLKALLGESQWTEVWTERRGQAGDRPLPSPDGHTPLFASRLNQAKPDWVAPFRLPEKASLKIVFADSGNVAGSVLHHAKAVNEFTSSRAWALTLAPHPLIGARSSDHQTIFLQESGGRPTPEQEAVLRDADLFVFFEDDDETSDSWPFPLHQLVGDKPALHLYIGYRVHQRSERLQRRGRRILSPLPHLLKMYPQAHFYAGFPPQETLELPLVNPASVEDGVCRILHTPSVPHWTTARYPYHKDTEAFLRSARELKRRFKDKVELHQVGGWSQREVLAARQVCDITFNQLRGFHGLSGDEAMLLERPCVQSFDRSNINRHREYWGLDADFPWVTARSETLTETLAGLIESPEIRLEIGRRSRAFMLKYFSPQEGILPLLFHCYQAVKGG